MIYWVFVFVIMGGTMAPEQRHVKVANFHDRADCIEFGEKIDTITRHKKVGNILKDDWWYCKKVDTYERF